MDNEYLREWHEICLPSLGVHYGDKLPAGRLKITPWTVAQEEAIARNSENRQDDLTHELLKSNVAWPEGFAYEDMLLTDQFFALLQLRVISFLDFMTLTHSCPQCGDQHPVEVKLNNITIRTPDETDPDEPYSCFLPKRKVKIELRQQRVGDLLAAERYLKSAITTAPELRRKFLYARQIVSVGGESAKFDEKMHFVSTLALLDLNAITNVIEKNSTGYRGTYTVECPQCKTQDERWVPPIHEDFFRPKSTDVARACQLAEQD